MPVVNLNVVTDSYSGLDAHFGMDEFLFSAQVTDIDHDKKAATFDGSGLGTAAKNNQVGMQDGTLKVKGVAANAAGEYGNILYQRFGRKRPVNAWYTLDTGLVVGCPITFQPSRISSRGTKITTDKVVTIDAEMACAGAIYEGFVALSPAALLSGDSDSGPSHDNTPGGGASTAGGAAIVSVWALDGGTTPGLEFVVEHCATGSGTWTSVGDPIEFDGIGSQIMRIPSTISILPFTRISWTATGSPTAVQVMGAIARGYSRAG